MDKKRAEVLASIAYIIVADELGITARPLEDDELVQLLVDNHVTLEEMSKLDEVIQNMLEILNYGLDDDIM